MEQGLEECSLLTHDSAECAGVDQHPNINLVSCGMSEIQERREKKSWSHSAEDEKQFCVISFSARPICAFKPRIVFLLANRKFSG